MEQQIMNEIDDPNEFNTFRQSLTEGSCEVYQPASIKSEPLCVGIVKDEPHDDAIFRQALSGTVSKTIEQDYYTRFSALQQSSIDSEDTIMYNFMVTVKQEPHLFNNNKKECNTTESDLTESNHLISDSAEFGADCWTRGELPSIKREDTVTDSSIAREEMVSSIKRVEIDSLTNRETADSSSDREEMDTTIKREFAETDSFVVKGEIDSSINTVEVDLSSDREEIEPSNGTDQDTCNKTTKKTDISNISQSRNKRGRPTKKTRNAKPIQTSVEAVSSIVFHNDETEVRNKNVSDIGEKSNKNFVDGCCRKKNKKRAVICGSKTNSKNSSVDRDRKKSNTKPTLKGRTFKKAKYERSRKKEQDPISSKTFNEQISAFVEKPVIEDNALSKRKKHTRTDSHKCEMCAKSFRFPSELEDHKMLHTGAQSYNCLVCGQSFAVRHKFICHQKIHNKIKKKRIRKKRHKCEVCKKTFKYPCYLEDHKNLHTGVLPYTCQICKKSFGNRYTLKSHQKIHDEQRIREYTCTICGKGFYKKYNLTNHKNAQHPPGGTITTKHVGNPRGGTNRKQFYCVTCGREFSAHCSLVVHERLHSGERPYNCGQCDKKFISSSKLRLHERTIHEGVPVVSKHSLEVRFCCAVCGKGFSQYGNLKSHEKNHTGERPFSCSQCKKKFVRLGQLEAHKRVHSQERPYMCDECGMCFKQSAHRKTHMVKHTTERPFSCSVCGRGFKTKSDLQQHLKRHAVGKI